MCFNCSGLPVGGGAPESGVDGRRGGAPGTGGTGYGLGGYSPQAVPGTGFESAPGYSAGTGTGYGPGSNDFMATQNN